MLSSGLNKILLGALALATAGSCTLLTPSSDVACKAIQLALPPGRVNYPDSPTYAKENTYWSSRQTDNIAPACFVAPKNAFEVAATVKVLVSLNTQFSVKGGGHTAFAGGSNSDGGVTIDLMYLTTLNVSSDRKTVSIGAGNRWINVSEALDTQGLVVVGGRVADVGVSGLILGGGISYFSGMYGWACDNVRNYEVVLASGLIVNASPTKNKDLYWALRGGGGSNFGIVTRFDVAAYEQPGGNIWHNSLIIPGAANASAITMYQNLTVNGMPADNKAHSYMVLTHMDMLGGYAVISDLFHADLPNTSDSAHEEVPGVFQPFESLPTIMKTKSIVNVSTVSREIDIPYGSRQTWWDTTVKATDPSLLIDIVSLWQDHVGKLVAAAKGTAVTPFLAYQAIPLNVLKAMEANGGNALGLKQSDGPLMLIQLTAQWADSALDDLMESSSEEVIGKINDLAKSRGLNHGFVYANYAGNRQSVFESYGADNHAKLKQVALKWDPKGILRKLWKGYFKL
ncbi:hypothetical protein QBC45DRAFT_461635 [Copromyces sp. CBS 386.78]|nr:hypothetical protein QBC45DRAFT_461635 [Copromyces sp. CBS 386.78]